LDPLKIITLPFDKVFRDLEEYEKKSNFFYTYDEDVDCVTIDLFDDPSVYSTNYVFTETKEDNLNFDYDDQGRIISLEVISIKRHF